MGVGIDIGAGASLAEQLAAGILAYYRRAWFETIRVVVGTTSSLILPASTTRIGIMPCQPDAGSIRISIDPRMAAGEGVLLDATGTVAPLTLWSAGPIVMGQWFGIADAADRTLTLLVSHLPVGV